MTSIDDYLAELAPRTATARVLLRQEMIAEHERLDAELAAAMEAGRDSLDTEAPRLAAAIRELEAEMDSARRPFTFTAMGRRPWQQLLALHPPTSDQRKANPRLDHNPDTFPVAAIAQSCTTPAITLEQAKQLADTMNVAQFDVLWAKCLEANVGTLDAPKSLLAGGIARVNAKFASSAADTGSLDQSS